ncbi:hypothetical protein [Streptomyces yaizuensis]|uniref:Sugar kinase n=1 Tax=Streptomyces yaizuensis TaxID=2989713 RepID=A0ABQ5P605_9ACTN|nr:hypothetical protein [Streptomyces sp. YSPA8]GLF97987.1 sugar kinase [Streptomyces sp. YSPA8]
MTVPRQSAAPDENFRPPEDRRQMIIRRWVTAIIIVLLVGIPAGYLVISAQQSRESGRHKAAESSASGMRDGWPSQMKRRIFEIPIPAKSTEVAYFETSNWRTSRLYVRFTTTEAGLDGFLNSVGTPRDTLREGDITIGDRDADIAGWDFTTDRQWQGTRHEHKKPRPSRDIVVDTTDPAAPTVYIVSTATP